MKISEIVEKYGLNEFEFNRFLNHQLNIKVSGVFSPCIDDDEVEAAVAAFKDAPRLKAEKEQQERERREEQERKAIQEREKREEERLAAERVEKEKQKALASMLISSGFSFEGYHIVKYSGYISGDDAVEIPRTGWFSKSDNGQKLTDALVKIRIQAMKELKEAAYELGCNAVVGVDFDYITLEPQTMMIGGGGTILEPYIICVTANGNAVVIEKDE